MLIELQLNNKLENSEISKFWFCGFKKIKDLADSATTVVTVSQKVLTISPLVDMENHWMLLTELVSISSSVIVACLMNMMLLDKLSGMDQNHFLLLLQMEKMNFGNTNFNGRVKLTLKVIQNDTDITYEL